MKEIIETFIDVKEKIHTLFNVSEEFFIKPILECEWDINEIDGIMFFKYKLDNKIFEQVVVRQNGENLYKVINEYTLIVAIDCVKISFLVKNSNRATL
ncbi:MAG: hypothetical protein ACK5LY_00875 [Lachnospirales bacterium]